MPSDTLKNAISGLANVNVVGSNPITRFDQPGTERYRVFLCLMYVWKLVSTPGLGELLSRFCFIFKRSAVDATPTDNESAWLAN